ncbi:unnamed protein product [Rhizophagus irregularis]|nr:unnamed protein product [Rhizophagus irregularis]
MAGAKARGKKKKKSLIGEHYYEEFSTEFWKESGTQRPNVANIGTTSSNTLRRQPSRILRAIPSPNRSRPTTPLYQDHLLLVLDL